MTPIDKPGVYEIDIDLYHTQACCIGPSISSSGLRKLIHECPAKYWAFSDLNPAGLKDEGSNAFAFGRAAHALVLGEPEFNSKFIISPFDDFRTKEARAWRDEQTKQVVKAEEMETVKAMAAAQLASPQVARAFEMGKPELSLIWPDAETGIWMKSRPDWLPDRPSLRFLIEYKTCVSIEPHKLSLDVFKYGYEMQAAMALDAVEIVMGKKPLGLAHVVQEKEPPYLCDLRMFTPEQIAYGRLQYRKALRIFAHCIATATWPAYTTEPQFFETPYSTQKAMEYMNDAANSDPGYSGADFLAAG